MYTSPYWLEPWSVTESPFRTSRSAPWAALTPTPSVGKVASTVTRASRAVRRGARTDLSGDVSSMDGSGTLLVGIVAPRRYGIPLGSGRSVEGTTWTSGL